MGSPGVGSGDGVEVYPLAESEPWEVTPLASNGEPVPELAGMTGFPQRAVDFSYLFNRGYIQPHSGVLESTYPLMAVMPFGRARLLAGGRNFTPVADVTKAGARYANIAAKITPRTFEVNLVESGYKVVRQTIGANGPVTVFSNGSKSYTIYTANSTGAASAQVTNASGKILSKIRFVNP